MAYSYQTYSVGEVLTAAKIQQLEDNVRDHVHGEDGVSVLSLTDSLTAMEGETSKASSSSGASWTTVSIASDTGSDTAIYAILKVQIQTTGATGSAYYVELRKTGTTPGSPHRVEIPTGGNSGQMRVVERTIVVPLDGSEQFDYQAVISSGSWEIFLIGYAF